MWDSEANRSSMQDDWYTFMNAKHAIKNHFIIDRQLVAIAQDIHHLWNAWPDAPIPLEVTQQALEALQMEEFLMQVEQAGKVMWKKSP
jgi:hypothetical protein